MEKRLLITNTIILVLFFAAPVLAWSKTGTIYSTDGSYNDVAFAVADASSGDTVSLPQGTFDWGAQTLTINKKVSLIGQGMDNTIIESSVGELFLVNNNNAAGFRISSFRVNKESGYIVGISAVVPDFRIDHVHFYYPKTANAIGVSWPSKTVDLQGLVDNCVFERSGIILLGPRNQLYGFETMVGDKDLGGPSGLYVEDSIFYEWDEGGSSPSNMLDACCGVGYVSRYNEVHGTYHEAHGIQGNYNLRGTKKVEMYRNVLDGGYDQADEYSWQWQPTNLRVTSAMLWQNEIYNHGRNGLYLSEYRIRQAEGDLGQCDGSNGHDSNYDSSGWLCFEQPGSGGDKELRTESNPHTEQFQEPIYIFGNTVEQEPYNVVHVLDDEFIKSGRDYFVEGDDLGVSVGLLADMPGTCTEGEGYWATDQGEWNQGTGPWAGQQGVLYRCSVTGLTGDGDSGTWELHYTPYEYPHPLRNEDSACPSLPEGDNGIAASYPGDEGIENHADVILADDFESYSAVSELWDNWDNMHHTQYISFDTVDAFAGSQSLEFRVPQTSTEIANALTKDLNPTEDIVFIRAYTKFSTDFSVIGSGHNGLGLQSSYWDGPGSGPGIPADGYNKFYVNVENSRGDSNEASPGLTHTYIYHPEQRDIWGDHFYPEGRVVPYDVTPGDFGDCFIPRPNFTPEMGRWYSYELMVKVNTPGQRDGRIAIWIDGDLFADFTGMRLRETTDLKIDRADISLHAGSPTDRENKKWYDNVVVARSYIGPMFDGPPTCLTISELADKIEDWKSGTININQVMQTITQWKRGC